MNICKRSVNSGLRALVPSMALVFASQFSVYAAEVEATPPVIVEDSAVETGDGEVVPPPNVDARMDEVAAAIARMSEGKSAAASYHYEKGTEAYAAGRLQEAINHLRIALDYKPQNEAYRKKLREVGAAAGVVADTSDVFADVIADQMGVEQQRLLIEIERKIEIGLQHRSRQEYAMAITSFNMALVRLHNLPFANAHREPKMRQVEALIADTQTLSEKENIERARTDNELAQEQQKERRAYNLGLEQRRIEAMLGRAQNARARRNYDEAILYCESILKINPSEARAHDLLVRSRRERHIYLRRVTADLWDEEHLRLHENIADDLLPQMELVKYSSDWHELDARRSAPVRSGLDDTDAAWRQEIENKLEQKLTLNFLDNDIQDVVQFLQSQTDVNIILDPQVIAEGDIAPITMEMSNVRLVSALQFIMQLTDLRYSLQDEAIYISNEDGLRGDAVMKIYDIRDLINPLTMFPGPRMQIPEPGGDGGDLITEVAGQEEGTVDDFIELISQVVSPESWEEDEGITIEEYNGNMVITQTPDVHKQVDELLRTLRHQRGVQISVSVKWLEVTDSMLELITFEWDNWQPNTGGAAPAPSAGSTLFGFYASNSRNLSTADVQTNGISNYFERTGFGNPQGAGFAGQLHIFKGQDPDGLLASLLVNAVEQSDRANVAIEPRITLFNGQRAHLVQLTQQSYVSDYDVVGDQYDPVISVLAYGTVLDVTAIASADRKYITMTLQPTSAELQQFREFNLTSDINFGATNAGNGNAGLPGAIPQGLNYPLTVPEVQYRMVQTSVTIPDGGTMLIAGITNASSSRSHQGVPFLSHIPFLGRLFSGNGRSEVETKTIISVHGDIILFDELEKEL